MAIEKGSTIRRFETGATRDRADTKLNFEGFLSPLVLEKFAEYMHRHRNQADGNLRDADNWQKGIPIPVYMESLWRHFFDVWKVIRGLESREGLDEATCGAMFNLMGMYHEILKMQRGLAQPEGKEYISTHHPEGFREF